MNIKEELLSEHSKRLTVKLSGYIGINKKLFSELMKCVLGTDKILASRAAWVMSYCVIKNPVLIESYLEKLIKNLNADVHVAVKRNTVKVLQYVDIPEKLWGRAATACIYLLQSNKEPVAVKVFSMTVLANICKHEPELATELKLIIENQLPFASAGFKARAKKILR